MADSFFDKFIAELVKGAELNSRANGGPGVNIIVDRENRGREEKLANHAALGALGGGLVLPGLGAPIGAALGADKGQGLAAAGGSLLGGAGGGLAGGGIGALLGALGGQPGLGAMIGAGAGGIGGMMYGAQKGGHKDTLSDKLGALKERYAAGVDAAKVAFLGALGSMAGSIGGGMLARKALPQLGGLAGHAAEMGGQMLGGAVGQHLTQPQQPSQPGM